MITVLANALKPLASKRSANRRLVFSILPYLDEFVMAFEPLPWDSQIDLDEMYKNLRCKRKNYTCYDEAYMGLMQHLSKKNSKPRNSSLQSIQESIEENDGLIAESENESENSIDDDNATISTVDEFQGDDGAKFEDRSVGRSQEEESFERELALAMGFNSSQTSNQTSVDQSNNAISKKLSFKVMTKRGGRDGRSKLVHIPVSSGVAQRLQENKEAEAAEKAALKRLVLASEY
jgi:regulator of nonsense transcripts 2